MIVRFFVAVVVTFAGAAFAAQPLTLVTTTGPGSMSDTAARFAAMLLERDLGRPVIVDNKPGALGVVGLRYFHGLPHDGNAVLVAGTQLAYISKVSPQPDFDPMQAFKPLGGLVYTPQQILVPSASPAKKPADLLAIQKAKGRLDGGSSHPSTQTSMGLLDALLGTKTVIVNYKQSAQLATELAGNFIDYTIGGKGNGSTSGLVESGLLRVIGNLKDLGVEEFSWVGLFVHKEAPSSAQNELSAAIANVMKAKEWADFQQQRWDVGPEEVLRTMAREHKLIPAP